jgi:hypothetical protein
MRKECERLKYHAEIALMRRQSGEVDAVDEDASFCRFLQPGDHPEERGLAAAGGAEQADECTVRNAQRDVIHSDKVEKALRYIFKNQTRHDCLGKRRTSPGRGQTSGGDPANGMPPDR